MTYAHRMARLVLTAFVACATLFLTAWPDDAEARRLGGGRSFGIQRQITPPPRPAQIAPAPKPATPGATPQTTPRRSSWLGPLGGLAAGLGLAWLFSSLGLSDEFGSLLLIALFAGGLFWLFRRWQSPQMRPAETAAGASPQATWRTADRNSWPSNSWPSAAAGHAAQAAGDADTTNPLRAQLDETAFLQEAKRQFVALQAAHDAQDWAAIARLVTPQLLAELQANPTWEPSQQTDVVQLSAELLDLTDEGDHYLATVRFSGLIRETPSTPPASFAELLHLVKPKSGGGWKVAGIQPA